MNYRRTLVTLVVSKAGKLLTYKITYGIIYIWIKPTI